MGGSPRVARIPPPQYSIWPQRGSVPFAYRILKIPEKNMGAFFFGKAIKNTGIKIL